MSKYHEIKELRVLLLKKEKDILICKTLKTPLLSNIEINEIIQVKVNKPSINKAFDCNDFWENSILYLLDIQMDKDDFFYPKIIVLEPDYLLDVSAIAECFQDYGTSEYNYLLSKLIPVNNNKHILLGNFANMVVDEIFSNPIETDFDNTFLKHFQSIPFEYTTCKDIDDKNDFLKFQADCKGHYVRIKSLINNNFKLLGINIDKVVLEPTFISEKYGIQGRLDILDFEEKEQGISKIIELKSGTPPFPDDGFSIKPSHQVQLFLYYLLISQANKLNIQEWEDKIHGYILYSKTIKNNLRHKTPSLEIIQEILNTRNKIIINEHIFLQDNIQKTEKLIFQINSENIIKKQIHNKFNDILATKINSLLETFIKSSEIEKKYFITYLNYVSYEHYLNKIGICNSSNEKSSGLASIWLNNLKEKQEKFEIIYDLIIHENKIDTKEQTIIFKKTNLKNQYSNFREGDICILYPKNENYENITGNQLFKCTIKSIQKDFVEVYFRYKQRNQLFFKSFGRKKKWALERDFLDSSFNTLYKNLFQFLQAKKITKNLILTIDKPRQNTNYQYNNLELSPEQNRIINKALSAKDYFILNGPPGTGKTSIIIKNLVKELKYSQKNILILAYTNRAVDELCDAINSSFGNSNHINFIRFGTELSTADNHRKNLLKNIIGNFSEQKMSRNLIRKIVDDQHIFVGTIASIGNNEHIFNIKNFDIAIIDEASQVLEPQIIGILSKINKFILIGDHKQLPAISLQENEKSKVLDVDLHKIGIFNRNNSLFERLYKYCVKNKLDFAYDTLTYQGRMHQEIAEFPNTHFYDGILKESYYTPNISNSIKSILKRQINNLNHNNYDGDYLTNILTKNRLLYINTKKSEKTNKKYNIKEVNIIIEIIKKIQEIYRVNNKTFNPEESIGIITPFRSQIALIKQKLEEAKIDNFETITVDSVERFQGSQRDIIIYSFSVNSDYQLHSICNLNNEGTIDRKLNVALTRAKEQLILIGNAEILAKNPIYKKLIDYYKSKNIFINDDFL